MPSPPQTYLYGIMIVRLAPTPSGYLHKGNVFNFLLNWLWARGNGGKVLLRIDDGDAARKRTEYLEDIFRVLEWLGMDWDIGPASVQDFEQHWSQQHRLQLYNEWLNQWAQQGTIYACTCSRKQMEEVQTCACREKNMPLNTPGAAWRMPVPTAETISIYDKALGNINGVLASFNGSVIVRRKDGIPAYQLCSLADDHHFHITHIARGEDLLPSTLVQLYLNRQSTFPFLHQCRFWHHPLVQNKKGEKLSKSAGAGSESILNYEHKPQLLTAFAEWLGYAGMNVTRTEELLHLPVFKELY